MTGDTNDLTPGNDCFTSEMIASKVYGLPTSVNAHSDPTVLKSLRAFRPNAHKTKNDFIQSVTESCYNSKTISGKIVSNRKSTVFDCNDNKFITKSDRFSFGSKDIELHFRTGGVRTKKYNDVIRTIKEDLISVSNIPSVANNATVNVVHVHDSQQLDESSQNVQSNTSGASTTTVASTLPSRNTHLTSSVQKPKPESESTGSQLRKSTSSQSLSHNAVISYSNSPVTTAATILTSALTRVNPVTRPGGTYVTSNQLLSAAPVRPSGSKVVGQPQYMAIVNRNSFNQTNNPASQAQNLDCQNVSNSVVGFVTSSSVKTTGQNFITQATRTPVQTARVVAVPTMDTSRFLLESERPNVILSKNFGVQNVRTGTPTLYNHVAPGLNNNATQIKVAEDSTSNNANVVRPTVASLSTAVSVEGAAQVVSNSRLSFDSTVQNNPSKVTILSSKLSDFQKPLNETAGLNVVSGANSSFLNASKPNTLRLSTETDTHFYSRNNTYSKNSSAANSSTNQTPPQTYRSNNSKAPHTVILQTNMSVANRNSPLSDVPGTKRSFSLVKAQTSSNLERVPSEQEDLASRTGLINNVSSVSPLTLELRNVSSVATTTTASFGNRSYSSSNLIANKTPYNEVVRIVQSMTGLNQSTPTSSLDVSEMNSSTAANQTSVGESGEVIAIIDSSPTVKLESSGVVPSRNILATVLKRNSMGNLLSPITTSTSSQYSIPNTRNPIEINNQSEGIQNVMISQSSNSSTIHYTVVNPMQQEIQQDGLNSISGDLIERVVKQNNFDASQSIMSPLMSQIENSDFVNEASTAGMSSNGKNAEKYGSLQDLNAGNQQQVGIESKRVNKSSSSPSTVQTEGGFIKKQVLNNQKITILVQNNEGDRDKSENQQKGKMNELLYRDDQKTCITFRAIKRTQSDGNQNESPAKKKGATGASADQNGDTDNPKMENVSEDVDSEAKNQVNSSESLCQYLVLEAINDPAGALPKFNQAFGKSYQVIKLATISSPCIILCLP